MTPGSDFLRFFDKRWIKLEMSIFTTLYLVPKAKITDINTDLDYFEGNFDRLVLDAPFCIDWGIFARTKVARVVEPGDPIAFNEKEGFCIIQWTSEVVEFIVSATDEEVNQHSIALSKIDEHSGEDTTAHMQESFLKLSGFLENSTHRDLVPIEYATF